jgi:hypothetical protein
MKLSSFSGSQRQPVPREKVPEIVWLDGADFGSVGVKELNPG